MKVSKKRWTKAQDYEKDFWLKNKKTVNNKVIEENLKNYAKNIKKELRLYTRLNKNSNILQIGAGYRDVINFWDIGRRFMIDSLTGFYLKNFPVKKNNIRFTQGIGENLPYKSNYFDVILMMNVLDHTQEPEKVLSEIYRTLKKKGILYLTINSFSRTSSMIRYFLEIFQIDKGHPHTFTCEKIDELLRRKNFKMIKRGSMDRKKIINEMRNSKNIKLKTMSYLNMAVIPYKVICIK